MTPPYDPITLIGGGGLFGAIAVLFTLLVRRLTAQDTGWKTIVEHQAQEIQNLRAELAATRLEQAALRIQVAELQRWEAERRDQ